tara:strand:- start:7167 stop:11000 length:3834 start_codon:yes stop_codon:yes gene_type:complete
MAIQIGKYKRPGIFIEEFDRSVFTSPTVEGITNLVIGVSKKGPVNDIVKITNINDLESIFGPLDRNLERKGSFFHRTISKMLESSPIFALNLLKTDDLLDIIEYKSISSSSGYNNDVKRTGPYRRFFNTSGFWKRDTESFINLTKDNVGYEERVLNFTNLSDKHVSIFVFKTQKEGFDTPLLNWYGSVDKIPPYLNANDYASDYMVDVVVVGGDWSNYQDLSVDPKWSQYFSPSGLRKEQIGNFANDNNVNLLNYYEGLSLIPFFRDTNGRDIFIENNINADTDRTGLFCSFNIDLVETDFRNSAIDLIGHTIAGENETDIEFLSYKETIAESITFKSVPLDLPGNVTSLGNKLGVHTFDSGSGPQISGVINGYDRTSWFSEGVVSGVDKTTPIISTTSSIKVEYTSTTDSFAIIGDEYIPVGFGTASLVVTSSDYTYLSATVSYTSTTVLDNTGVIKSVSNFANSDNPSVSVTDIVLGYVNFDVFEGQISNVSDIDVTVDTNGYVGLSSVTDYVITEASGVIKVEFQNTNSTPDVKNYEQYRRFKSFNRLISILDSPNSDKVVMKLNTAGDKISLTDMTLSNIVTSSTEHKSFKLDTGLTSVQLVDIISGDLTFYTEDNEMLIGSDSVVSKSSVGNIPSGEGVVGKYSDLYNKFYDGVINTGDFFYSNKIPASIITAGESVEVNLINGEDAVGITSSYAGLDYIVFDKDMELETFDKIILPTSLLNKGTFTISQNDVNPSQSSGQLAVSLGYTASGYNAYQVNENTTNEIVTGVESIYDFNTKHYLKMYLENVGDVKIQFMDELLSATEAVDIEANNYFSVQSRNSNFKQTIEIEVPVGYTRVSNKILVKADRYTEVKVGDFLSAYYDSSELEIGESPRTLTRILSKRAYVGDSSLSEITCDSKINVSEFNGDLQTLRYRSIDNYASTYKSIPLKGFRLRNDSLPNGSEQKQNEILNLVAKGTPLFKALTNKEAVDFRYLIDSFGLGLTERSKQQLIDICGNRLDAFGIISAPSVKELKNSTSPTFVDSEGVFQTSFLKTGGDLESNPAFLFSLADGTGVTSGAYFGPYVTVNDNGRPLSVPPAPYIASTFMRKHLSSTGSITPWTIAAGVRDGRVTNIANIEIQYTPEDIENLNAAKINPIVFKRNRGYVIETENTAQTLLSSSLSYIHVREALIELERELSDMLLDYQWRYNTPDVRAEIKLRADTICETFVSKNGIFNYFNKMDDENNTTEIIENQIGVLDTYVEPIFGMGIIVNNITILRPGSISSGGFIQS